MTPLASLKVGSGPDAVIVMHGFLGFGRNVRTFTQLWSEKDSSKTFWLPDLPGHGESPPLTGFSLSDVATQVLSAATADGLTDPTQLVGHSLGGRVALAMSRSLPSLTRVVLLDIAPGPLAPEASDSRRVLDVLLQAPAQAPTKKEFRDFFIGHQLSIATAEWLSTNLVPGPDGFQWRIDRQALDRLHDAMAPEDFWPEAERLGSRLHCIRGGKSQYVSDRDVARLEALDARVDTLPNAGHYVHIEATLPLVELLA